MDACDAVVVSEPSSASPGTFREAVRLADKIFATMIKTDEVPVPLEEIMRAGIARAAELTPEFASKVIQILPIPKETGGEYRAGQEAKAVFIRKVDAQSGDLTMEISYYAKNLCWARFLLAKEAAHAMCDKKQNFTGRVEVLAREVVRLSHWRVNSLDQYVSSEVFAAILALELLLPRRHWKNIKAKESLGGSMAVAEHYRVPEFYVLLKFQPEWFAMLEQAYGEIEVLSGS